MKKLTFQMIRGDRFYNTEPTEDEILAQQAASLAGKDPEEGGPGFQESTPKPNENETWKPNPLWDIAAERYGTEEKPFEIPEAVKTGKIGEEVLTREQEMDLFIESLKPADQKPAETVLPNDPFVLEYMSAKKKWIEENPDKEFTPDVFVESYSKGADILKMNDDEVILAALRKSDDNPNGYTEEQINEHLKSLDPIQKGEKANSYREQIRKARQDRLEKMRADLTQIDEKRITETNSKLAQLADATITSFKDVQTIGSLPHGESEQNSFAPYFKAMSEVNPETGQTRVMEFLNNDKRLYKALFLLKAAESGDMDKYLSTYKENFKKGVLEKTGLEGKGSGGGGGIKLPDEVDPKVFV